MYKDANMSKSWKTSQLVQNLFSTDAKYNKIFHKFSVCLLLNKLHYHHQSLSSHTAQSGLTLNRQITSYFMGKCPALN